MSTLIIQKGRDKVEFGVSSLPNRKNAALIRMRGAMIEPLAYFINDEKAAEFEKILDYILEMSNNK